MKLIKLYIENFGKISKTEYDFSDNLTCFCEENGFGKTTIATFIKVMFYGMPIVKTNSKFNDREHYYPFDGGKFGGNLTFEKDGKIYKVVRFFDKKSEKKDEIYFYENDNLVENIPENIGKFVFSVDESSFLRTLYFNEISSLSGSSSDITLKLTGIIENDEDFSFENAKKKLEEASKLLKRSGGKGEIFEAKQQIVRTKEEIQNLKTISDSLNVKYQNKNSLTEQLKACEGDLKKVSDEKIKLDNFKTYESYLKEAEAVKNDIEKVSKDYPFGLLSDSEINEVNLCFESLKGIEKQREYAKINESILKEYEELNDIFKNGVPSNEEIENYKNNVKSLTKEQTNGKQIKNMPLLFLGVLEIIVSFVLIFLNTIVGVMFLSVGVLFICISLFVNGKDKNSTEKQDKADKLREFLQKFNIISDNYLDGIYELKGKIDRYNFLNAEFSRAYEKNTALDEEFSKNLTAIKLIFNKYKINMVSLDRLKEQIKGIENDIIYLRNKKTLYESFIKRAESYKKEKNIQTKPSGEISSYDEIYLKCENIRSQISVIDRDIKNSEDALEALNEKQNKLLFLEESLEKLNNRYGDITLALEFLINAEQSLKDKYITPVKQSFISYTEQLEKVLGEKVIMDKNFQIYFERSGENKSREHLSAGQNVLCDLCLRLALLDNMYKDEKPFIILDDPFMSLDEKHIKNALNLLKELSLNRQIIYFACHESRKI